MNFIERLVRKLVLKDSNSVKTNKGRLHDSEFKSQIDDGNVYMIDGNIIVDTTLYQDIYWETMKRNNPEYYEENYQRSREYRESWLKTPNGLAWKQRHGHS